MNVIVIAKTTRSSNPTMINIHLHLTKKPYINNHTTNVISWENLSSKKQVTAKPRLEKRQNQKQNLEQRFQNQKQNLEQSQSQNDLTRVFFSTKLTS